MSDRQRCDVRESTVHDATGCGWCARCKRWVRLNEDGRLRLHRSPLRTARRNRRQRVQ